jgi:hypothetical protein
MPNQPALEIELLRAAYAAFNARDKALARFVIEKQQ